MNRLISGLILTSNIVTRHYLFRLSDYGARCMSVFEILQLILFSANFVFNIRAIADKDMRNIDAVQR